jgi:hypothetical protein
MAAVARAPKFRKGRGTMHGDLQAARKLLADLCEAYRGLPPRAQAEVAQILHTLSHERTMAQEALESSDKAFPMAAA